MIKEQWVKDLKGNEEVKTEFMILEKEIKPFISKEGEYLQLQLGDKTGEISALCWNPQLINFDIKKGDVIEVKGVTQKHKEYGLQIIFNPTDIKLSEEYELRDFLKSTSKDINELMDELLKTIEEIKIVELGKLLHSFFNDKEFVKKFKEVPATLLYNHNYIGGLLEHTVSVIRICKTICNIYPELNKDLLLTAAILNKIGKTEEYKIDRIIDIAEEGGLMGHIILGDRLLQKKFEKFENFPKDLKLKLNHMVVSRFSKTGYGSQQRPKFPEAAALVYADYLDSNVQGFKQMFEESKDEEDIWFYNKKRGYYLYLK
ncbi:MAG: HD domain-containing protein [Nanoarchaeota archaeon]|nr:HD domain-containing protein [Nanoarchaeota archaeon]